MITYYVISTSLYKISYVATINYWNDWNNWIHFWL